MLTPFRLKESDVTWLYGPLQPAQSHPITQHASEPSSQLSKNNSFVNKKPILKKRSMSEVMLQRSISASSLLKQAAASVQAQQTRPHGRPTLGRAHTDFEFSAAPSEVNSRDPIDYFPSSHSTSGGDTPCQSSNCKRHIRFDDKVEQCIAVDAKDGDFDDESESEAEERRGSSSDSSSDDGVVMMKKSKKSRRPSAIRQGSRTSSTSGRKTIETLPSTTLKYRTDSPDVPAQPPTPFGRSWNSSKLSPSPSQETLRPSHPSKNFLLAEEDDDNEVDLDSTWNFGSSNPKSSFNDNTTRRDSVAVHKARSMGYGPRDSPEEEGSGGLRRTPSGIGGGYMPYEEDEDDLVAAGLFGQVSDLYNTARDIGHVIWNVGWRK